MKHAIMVTGHGNTYKILQKTINILDSNSIDFFIHWDAKYSQPKITIHYSNIQFITKP